MNYDGMAGEFVNFINGYKIKKVKELTKEIGDSIDKNLEIVNDKYYFSKQEIVWKDTFILELEKWDKFKTEKGFTDKKLKDRVSKKIKEFLGSGEPHIDVIQKLKSLKVSLGIESYESSLIRIKLLRKWIKTSKKIEVEYAYSVWLDWASANAKNIGFSTHVAKLTHSTIKGATNIYFDKEDKNPYYFSTATLRDKSVDISQTDNKLAPIGKLLQLEFDNITLIDKLKKRDVSDLKVFAKNDEQLKRWEEMFFDSFKENKPSSHFLAKQMYFPVEEDYHMLSPLVSSSLDHAIYEKIQYSKHKETKKLREQKKNNKFYDEDSIAYPHIAVLMVTASNHSNASPLNGKRVGMRYLFPSTPPEWKSSLTPPIKNSSLFYGEYDRRVWEKIKQLQEYLLKAQDTKPNMHMRNDIKRAINWIIDALFDYVTEIQNMKTEAGWSRKAEHLKGSHKLWLDPYRNIEITNDAFQIERKRGEWQDEVCLDFGKWLNKKLEHKKMLFAKIESDRWAKLLKGRLREFERDLEVLR